jgi:hypothetical protein
VNQSNIISLPVSAANLEPFRRMKFGAAGLEYAGAADPSIGTFLPADPGMDVVGALQPRGIGIHFVIIGSNTDVAVGDTLEAAADGKLVKLAAGLAEAVALEACSDLNDQIRAVFLPNTGFKVVAAGIHTWAGGAAVADSIAVAGLVATDIVVCTLTARAAAETLILAVNDHANDQIDLTLSANGTNGTTKINWLVLRA